jgi:hypothetical protein
MLIVFSLSMFLLPSRALTLCCGERFSKSVSFENAWFGVFFFSSVGFL